MNLPNKLTLLRMCLISFFLLALLYEKVDSSILHVLIAHVTALVIYIGASLTDYYDGLIARRHNLVTNFGKLIDPIADKLLVLSAFVSLVELQIFPAWIVIVIFWREFLVTGLRAVGASKGRVIQADRWGKYKMVAQTATIIAALIFMILRDLLIRSGRWGFAETGSYWQDAQWIHWVLMILVAICVVLTVFSGANYIIRNRDLIRD